MAKPLITVLLLLIVNGVDDKVSVFVTESGILDVERFSTAIVFYLQVENHAGEVQKVTVACKECCLDIDKDDSECGEIMELWPPVNFIIGGNHPTERARFVFRNLYARYRKGNCTFSIHSKKPWIIKHVINFNTFPKAKENFAICPGVDQDPDRGCSPVDCAIKYRGTRNFYRKSKFKCEKVIKCDTRGNGITPIAYYDWEDNLCHPLGVYGGNIVKFEEEHPGTDEEEEFNVISGFITIGGEEVVKRSLKCNHGVQIGSECVCDKGWMSSGIHDSNLLNFQWCDTQMLGKSLIPMEPRRLSWGLEIFLIILLLILNTALTMKWICIVYQWIKNPYSSARKLKFRTPEERSFESMYAPTFVSGEHDLISEQPSGYRSHIPPSPRTRSRILEKSGLLGNQSPGQRSTVSIGKRSQASSQNYLAGRHGQAPAVSQYSFMQQRRPKKHSAAPRYSFMQQRDPSAPASPHIMKQEEFKENFVVPASHCNIVQQGENFNAPADIMQQGGKHFSAPTSPYNEELEEHFSASAASQYIMRQGGKHSSGPASSQYTIMQQGQFKDHFSAPAASQHNTMQQVELKKPVSAPATSQYIMQEHSGAPASSQYAIMQQGQLKDHLSAPAASQYNTMQQVELKKHVSAPATSQYIMQEHSGAPASSQYKGEEHSNAPASSQYTITQQREGQYGAPASSQYTIMQQGEGHSSAPASSRHTIMQRGEGHSSVPAASQHTIMQRGEGHSSVPASSQHTIMQRGEGHSSVPASSQHTIMQQRQLKEHFSAPAASHYNTMQQGELKVPHVHFSAPASLHQEEVRKNFSLPAASHVKKQGELLKEHFSAPAASRHNLTELAELDLKEHFSAPAQYHMLREQQYSSSDSEDTDS